MSEDKTPPAADSAEKKPLHQAHKGVVDAGEIVTSAGEEPISGIVADITDADHAHHPHHKK